MTIKYFFKHCTDQEKETAREYCGQKFESIEKLIPSYEQNASTLEIRVERLPKKHAYTVTFVLHLPHDRIYAFEDDHTIREAVDFAKDKLILQLRRHTKRSQKEHHKGKRRRSVLSDRGMREFTPPADDVLTREHFFQTLLPFLQPIRRQLEREVGYAYMEGDLDPEGATAESILDTALLSVYQRFASEKKERAFFLSHIYEEALRLLRERREQERSERLEKISLERGNKQFTKDKKFATPIEEKIDPWQPDDDLKFEAMVREEEWFDPENERSREEIQEQLTQALSGLPSRWRQTLLLHVIDGVSVKDIAALQRRSVKSVQLDINLAKTYLKEKLQ